MSGFENMRSEVNQFLHPSVNPKDKHDPTFLGLSHKRRVHSSNPNSHPSSLTSTLGGGGGFALRSNPQDGGVTGALTTADQWLTHRGKHCDTAGHRHDPSMLTQDPVMAHPFSPTGSLKECRFGKGFERRAHTAIDAERPRLEAEAQRSVLDEERQKLVRQRHADRSRPLDLLSWKSTVTSGHFDTEKSRATNYTHFNYQSDSPTKVETHKQPPLYPSTAADKPQAKRTFGDKYSATTVGPPASTPEPGVMAAPTANPPLSNRILRFRSEGLVRPKEWGVAQQLKCGDGYVLPEIAPTGELRAARRQIRPQTVQDTRPW
eukprot:GILI01014884.1.p1 GENE.GILI01014884.1~~GILI01014884.1.p1  ORF type:complete len:319 (-),score=44.17 GILI01014884.1:214-1170(-)